MQFCQAGVLLAILAIAGSTDPASAAHLDDQDTFYNRTLFALCDSAEPARRQVCAAHLTGFAEGYIWNSPDRCYGPELSAARLRQGYLALLRQRPELQRDPSGGVLHGLMEGLTTTRCAGVPRRAP